MYGLCCSYVLLCRRDIDRVLSFEPVSWLIMMAINPLKCSGVRQLHLNVFSAIQV